MASTSPWHRKKNIEGRSYPSCVMATLLKVVSLAMIDRQTDIVINRDPTFIFKEHRENLVLQISSSSSVTCCPALMLMGHFFSTFYMRWILTTCLFFSSSCRTASTWNKFVHYCTHFDSPLTISFFPYLGRYVNPGRVEQLTRNRNKNITTTGNLNSRDRPPLVVHGLTSEPERDEKWKRLQNRDHHLQ